jgi:hypothetical protein
MQCEHFAVRTHEDGERSVANALYNHALLKHPVLSARMLTTEESDPSSDLLA